MCLWVIQHCMYQVYDVSKFMGEHPGGEEVVLKVTGRDIKTLKTVSMEAS